MRATLLRSASPSLRALPFRSPTTSIARSNIRGSPMPDVHSVTIQVRAPSRPGDTGQVSFGYYVVDDGMLTMTDGEGKPVRRRTGDLMTHKLKPGDDAETIARIFTRNFRLHTQGDSAG